MPARWTARFATAACGAALLTLSLTGSVAFAQDAGGGGGINDQVNGGAGNGGIDVQVAISGTAVGNGGTSTSGSSGGGTITVKTPPACRWDSLDGAYTGQTMWQMFQDVPQRWQVGSEASYLPDPEDIEAHKDDEGIWYTIAGGPNSSVEAGGGWDDKTDACMKKLRAGAGPGNPSAGTQNSGYLWVVAGDLPPQPPPTPPTPEQLRDAAEDALTLPVPEMGVNPAARTLVGLPTWFWVPPGDFRVWDITATAVLPGQPVASATVTATPAAFSVSSIGGSSGPCGLDVAVNAWNPGEADSQGCTISFSRSSIGQPSQAYAVTGTTAYATAWTSIVAGGPGPGGALVDQARSGQADVPVAESQALVRRAG